MNNATAEFIRQHADADVRQLALRGAQNPEVDLTWALEQIAGRQTAQKKLPSWSAVEGVVYPPHLSMEQCSSEVTARYKQEIVHGTSGNCTSVADLTGGFGVDFSFLAEKAEKAVYVERQQRLCDIARENFRRLGLEQAEVVCADAEDYLRQMPPVDLIYIDPARRDGHGGRTYAISDCTPDVLALLPLLRRKARRVLLKLAPMLDWRKAVSDLGAEYVSEVHIVAVQNECKELLILLEASGEKGEVRDYTVCCANLLSDGTIQRYNYCPTLQPSVFRPALSSAKNSQPSAFNSQYLYEPNAAIMKAGCFAELAQRFGVAQIAQNSHLFVADHQVTDFPGRTFRIEATTSLNKRELKEKLRDIKKANITVRNFPMPVAELRKRLKMSEGGSTYIFATTLATGEKVLLVCIKATLPQPLRG